MQRFFILFLLVGLKHIFCKLESEDDDTGESGDRELDQDSSERLGAAVTQITRHPYAASLLSNGSYICSAVILNEHWLITESKCFDQNVVTTTYMVHKGLKNFTIRVGSSYNDKGGTVYKISTLINNFDLKVTVMKLTSRLEYNSRIQAARLPGWDEEVTLGYLTTILAWTPSAHLRVVNAPIIESSICDQYTKLLPGHYICVGGVQDLNRKFCRRDNGGAVIQNNTLIGISSFLHTCALYSRTHAFPKVSSFARWLDSVIWDEGVRPTTSTAKTTTKAVENITETTESENRTPFYGDPRQYMLTLPFEAINVPLEPAGDNSVISRMSLYESYLQNMQNIAKGKTSTTTEPQPTIVEEKEEVDWMKKYGNSVMMIPQQRYSNYAYN